ncbi:MAG: flavodoxin domain-containing protein [Solirubrobacteraceae bacterium]
MTRVLVAYASKNGSTAEIADAIAQELQRRGLEVDCLEAGAVRHLESYEAVVLGSAVYAKRWRGSARRFLRRHRAVLASMPWWVFSSGPVGEPKPDDPEATAWLEPPKIMVEVERLGAREHVVFGGRVPVDPRNFIERAMVKNTPAEFADRRNWEEIAAWAARIAAQLEQGSGIPAAA